MALLVLSVIVLFHEFGHFLLARLNGIAVVEFSMGFGPRLLSWKSKKHGTRYSWKLIPFGGSCMMLGEFEEEGGGDIERKNSDSDGETSNADSAVGNGITAEIQKEFADGRHGSAFYAKSPLARLSVIAAGPIFNFIMAFVLAIGIVAWAGYDLPEIAEVVEGQAADLAGIEPGDVITRIGNRNVMLTREILLYMSFHSNEDLEIRYKRFDETTSQWKTYETYLDSDHYYYRDGRYLSGMNFGGYRSAVDSPAALFKYSMAEVRYTILTVIDSLGEMVRGQVKKEDIAGPVRIVTIIDDTVEQASPYGVIYVIMNVCNLIVMFSANLGVMNLLPLPALDGGRLIFIFIELILGRPLNQKVENAINLTGMALLMAFMVFVMFNDLMFLFL